MSGRVRRRRFAAQSILLFALALAALPAPAGTAEDLERAVGVFERLKSVQATAVNRLDRQRRIVFWANYYQALEELGRMKVHQRMMTQHRAERGAQFAEALREFERAVEVLLPMLPELQ